MAIVDYRNPFGLVSGHFVGEYKNPKPRSRQMGIRAGGVDGLESRQREKLTWIQTSHPFLKRETIFFGMLSRYDPIGFRY